MEIRVIKKDRGLGDTVARITRMTGIQSMANLISNGDASIPCLPCKKKQEKLNDLVSYSNERTSD